MKSNNRMYEAYYAKYENTISDSRWAEPEEVKEYLTPMNFKCAVYQAGGIPCLVDGANVYVDTGDSHTVVIGSSGSKKSRNIAIPQTLISIKAGESMVISDCKGEIYEWTSGFAKEKGYRIYVLNLRQPSRSHRWNPFYEPWRLMHEEHNIDAAHEMINDFIDDLFAFRSQVDPYWDDMSMRLFMGLCDVLLICADAEEATIKSLMYLRNAGLNMDAEGFLVDMTEELPRDSFTYSNLTAVFSTPDRTRTSIVSAFDSRLRLFAAQPNITELFSGSDFDICSFGEQKTILYIITPDEKTTYAKLMSTFVHQAYSVLISHATALPERRLKKRVNFILDEFGQLPYINDFPSAITAARSRNIRFTLFIQSMYQLKAAYGDDAEIILGNMGNTIFLNSRELPLLNRMAELCGLDKYGNPLISTSRLQRLKNKENGEALLLLGSCYPFITHLSDISSYHFDPSAHPAVELPKTEKEAPLFDTEKIQERFEWLLDRNCVFKDINKQEKEDDDISESDIRTELERKFDELFGSLENDDD